MEILHQLKGIDLILGSQSPRRKSLLESAGFVFRTWVIPTDEHFSPDLNPHKIALELSKSKAEPFKPMLKKNSILITADTIVVKNREILNKANTPNEARTMLQLLNGTSHEVITGVSITSAEYQHSFHETTIVHFHTMTENEMDYYIANYQPFDKAGAYGIQEWIGMTSVEKIEGCYYNVVGLPVAALYKEMKSFLQKYF